MCDYCLKHGGGKRWYENEKNYSRELFSARETQEFLYGYFSRSIEESRKTMEETLRSAKLPVIGLTVRHKMEEHYSENLHHQVVPEEVACNVMRMACRVCRLDCICQKGLGEERKCCIGLGFITDIADKYPSYTGGLKS